MSHNYHELEYLKSQFRCPCCGEVIGVDPDGTVEVMAGELLRQHIAMCRQRVKPDKIGDRLTDDE